MEYRGEIVVSTMYLPEERWDVVRQWRTVRAVSRRHAIAKLLKIATDMPLYRDRADHPNFRCEAEAILD